MKMQVWRRKEKSVSQTEKYGMLMDGEEMISFVKKMEEGKVTEDKCWDGDGWEERNR